MSSDRAGNPVIRYLRRFWLAATGRCPDCIEHKRKLHNQSFVLDAWKGHHEKLHPTCDTFGPGGEAKRRG